MKFLNKITINNLWGDKPIEINFEKNVTILTGINGSGKSSILNVIYDTLHTGLSGSAATSKNRMWVSECEITDNIHIQGILLPPLPESKQESVHKLIKKYVGKSEDKISLLSDTFTNELNMLYTTETSYKKHVVYSSENNGSYGKISGFRFPKSLSKAECDTRFEALRKKPNAFLFQEDRKVMHDISKSNIDPTLPFWTTYSSSIDQRFFYIRDAMHIRESFIDSERFKILDAYHDSKKELNLETLLNDENYQELIEKKKEITSLYNSLNSYFIHSGKEIAKDQEDHKITLKPINSTETMSWHLLSRGEKTIIYLFLAVYLYKEKVSLFLLDEPEISLHIEWQEHLLKDLTKIAPETQFIITTHSPHLVMNGWMNNCLTVSLFKEA
ncbi:AAA family ATPase [Aeromonas hydrophila]